jgi:hypothetical protein
MTKLNLDDDNVEMVEITVAQARELDVMDPDTGVGEKLTTAMDNAQAKVFGGDHRESYLVIKITE